MTVPTPIPFAIGAKILSSDGAEVGAYEDLSESVAGSERAALVVRTSGTDNLMLVPLELIDTAASTTDTVRLKVDADSFRALRLDQVGGDETSAEREEPLTIPVHEEVLTPVTRDVHLGNVVIHKRVEEEPFETTVDLSRDEVLVEHVPVNREVEAAPEPRYEGDTLIIPVVEEVLVTEKRLVLREEVRVTRRRQTEQTQIHDVLRREVLDIQEQSAQGESSSAKE
jgi:uncharacterized protein (TIGR02271 family)